MQITTLLFGEMEISLEQIVEFPQGMPGFPDERQFVFNTIPDTPFTSMQSVSSGTHFFVMNPFTIFKEYEFEIPEQILQLLQIAQPTDVDVWAIVVLRDEIADSTANLQAPVIVNTKTRKGKQLILNQYHIRQPIFAQAMMAAQE